MSSARHRIISSQELKARWEEGSEGFSDDLNLRIRRALSWLERAETEETDPDAEVIFLWIAFNAAYAEETGNEHITTERNVFEDFFRKLIAVDGDRLIYDALWERFTGPIRLLLDNRFVFQPFWNHHNRIPGHEDWERRFENGKDRIRNGLAGQDTALILNTLFDRLYVLRNQLIHGGATWKGSVNRNQVTDGARILAFLVPVFIHLMIENPHVDWGPPNYPVVRI
ncbi:MAG: HEPN domain-containing protein [Chloroflexota bacterium]|nr:HEPN domain-containing protein [Chloroflexota bacterium]